MRKKRGKRRVKRSKQTKRNSPPVGEKWAHNRILKAEQAVKKHVRSPRLKKRHLLVFWMSVCAVVLINMLIAFIVIPLLTSFHALFFDSVVVLIGLIIGILYTYLLIDIAHLEKSHRTLAAVLIPGVVVVNVVLIGALGQEWGGVVQRSLWSIAIVYGIAFILPYIVDRLR
jgi:hypothetical protein